MSLSLRRRGRIVVGDIISDAGDFVDDLTAPVGYALKPLGGKLIGDASKEVGGALLDVATSAWDEMGPVAQSIARVCLQAMSTSMGGPLAWMLGGPASLGPQLASVTFVIPGLVRGESFDQAYFKELVYRVTETAKILVLGSLTKEIDALTGPYMNKVMELLKREGQEVAELLGANVDLDDYLRQITDELGISPEDIIRKVEDVAKQYRIEVETGLRLIESSLGKKVGEAVGITPKQLVDIAEARLPKVLDIVDGQMRAMREDSAAYALKLWNRPSGGTPEEVSADLRSIHNQHDLLTGKSWETLAAERAYAIGEAKLQTALQGFRSYDLLSRGIASPLTDGGVARNEAQEALRQAQLQALDQQRQESSVRIANIAEYNQLAAAPQPSTKPWYLWAGLAALAGSGVWFFTKR